MRNYSYSYNMEITVTIWNKKYIRYWQRANFLFPVLLSLVDEFDILALDHYDLQHLSCLQELFFLRFRD